MPVVIALAVPALCAVALITGLIAPISLAEQIDMALWLGIVPATLSFGLGMALRRWVSKNLFVYILGRAFLGTALCMFASGALAHWTGHALAATVEPELALVARWLIACPDVFSVRHTSVEAYLEPVVHEIKVSRADLLGDLKRPDKRAAYLSLGGACWYVLGQDARGRPIGSADEVPPECGVMHCEDGRLVIARAAPRRPIERLPFAVWMALARATPLLPPDDGQGDLANVA